MTATIEVKDAICDCLRRLALARFGRRLHALVLTGSFARDEGTCWQEEGKVQVPGDVECIAVFRNRAELPGKGALASLEREIEVALMGCGICVHVGLSAFLPSYFRGLPAHIFSYELKNCGAVLCGDKSVLSLIPEISADAISLEDGWRLLSNRMVELLEVCPQVPGSGARLPAAVMYRTAKLYLDMGTSLLVFLGLYEAGYRRRAQKIAELTATQECFEEAAAFRLSCRTNLREFSQRIMLATRLKLGGQIAESEAREFWEASVMDAQALWKWELAQLAGVEGELSAAELLERWTLMQPVSKRWRGWAHVVRECGWSGWLQWPGWMALAWPGSPRHRVYAEAMELFFRLPGLVDAGGQWHAQAAQVAAKYHKFVEGTIA